MRSGVRIAGALAVALFIAWALPRSGCFYRLPHFAAANGCAEGTVFVPGGHFVMGGLLANEQARHEVDVAPRTRGRFALFDAPPGASWHAPLSYATRGGSYSEYRVEMLHAAARSQGVASDGGTDVGLRCVHDPRREKSK